MDRTPQGLVPDTSPAGNLLWRTAGKSRILGKSIWHDLYLYNADRAENQNLVSALSITINEILCQFFEFTQNLKLTRSCCNRLYALHTGLVRAALQCRRTHDLWTILCPSWRTGRHNIQRIALYYCRSNAWESSYCFQYYRRTARNIHSRLYKSPSEIPSGFSGVYFSCLILVYCWIYRVFKDLGHIFNVGSLSYLFPSKNKNRAVSRAALTI